MLRLCVFCGSANGNDPAYVRAAHELAEALSARRIGLVYGGANRGVMGQLADALLERGGDVIGIMPRFLVEREVAHRGLTQLIVIDDLHERKALMAQHAHAFLALPGGFGTLDELIEVLTWRQLGLHDRSIGLLDVAGYYRGLLSFMQHMVRAGFVSEQAVRGLRVSDDPAHMLELLFASKS